LTKVDAGDFKHELLNQLRSTMAVNVLKNTHTHTHTQSPTEQLHLLPLY